MLRGHSMTTSGGTGGPCRLAGDVRERCICGSGAAGAAPAFGRGARGTAWRFGAGTLKPGEGAALPAFGRADGATGTAPASGRAVDSTAEPGVFDAFICASEGEGSASPIVKQRVRQGAEIRGALIASFSPSLR
ncbi:MAG: hypothetical protein CL910_13950 [Deltaproteobacteria bacterium]|nr:hypothetical protein [Deltaproteobacteria bacterium]